MEIVNNRKVWEPTQEHSMNSVRDQVRYHHIALVMDILWNQVYHGSTIWDSIIIEELIEKRLIKR